MSLPSLRPGNEIQGSQEGEGGLALHSVTMVIEHMVLQTVKPVRSVLTGVDAGEGRAAVLVAEVFPLQQVMS